MEASGEDRVLEETVIRTFSRARARSIGQIGHFSMFVFVSVEKDFFRARRLLALARKAQFLFLAHVAMAFPWICQRSREKRLCFSQSLHLQSRFTSS
jgi:hypothetical protein